MDVWLMTDPMFWVTLGVLGPVSSLGFVLAY